MNLNGVFVALRSVPGESYWWRTAETGLEDNRPASVLGFRDLNAAVLVEVEVESSYVSSYHQFKQQVLEAPLVVDENSVTFVSRRGDVFYFPRKQGDFLVNGQRRNAEEDQEYELFSNPFVHSKYNSGVLTANWSAFSLLIDVTDPKNPIRKLNANVTQ